MKMFYPRFAIFLWLVASLMGCVTNPPQPPPHTKLIPIQTQSYLDQGKRYFEAGYYKRAMRILLPLACDGIAEAQYAVGYMYYYGYGVAQDIEVGHFWIQRAANQGFQPAIAALTIMSKKANQPPSPQAIKRYGR